MGCISKVRLRRHKKDVLYMGTGVIPLASEVCISLIYIDVVVLFARRQDKSAITSRLVHPMYLTMIFQVELCWEKMLMTSQRGSKWPGESNNTVFCGVGDRIKMQNFKWTYEGVVT